VSPKLSTNPKPDEIHIGWILLEDRQLIWRWINGEIKDSDKSLSTFVEGTIRLT